jgi:outer membrane protein OmpA-like peptidoglycan-associated protein
VDITGSMQPYIDAIKSKIYTLSTYLKNNGIDYTFSLILFSDGIDRVYQPTSDVSEFLNWLNMVRAFGGADIKENALEALATATKQIKYRPSANKVVILLTDAPFHQAGEGGAGTTKYTTESMIKYLNDNEMRVFGIVPQKLRDYEIIAGRTRGYVYDMDYPISVIMNNFSSQLTNLYALRYRTDKPAIPDSIDISVINELRQELTRKTIPIVELGRKLIIENMLYPTGKSELPVVVQELEVLNEFMNNRPNVVVMIEGHTDGIGSDMTNDRLSLQRAESVKKYLTLKGINPNRIKTKGYGKRRPIASNLTEFGRKLNRRTEIVIIAK